jgi:hypothetical protein
MTGGTTVDQVGGEFDIHVSTSGNSYGGCLSDGNADFTRGAMFEVLSTTEPSAQSAYTVAWAYAVGGGMDLLFLEDKGELQAHIGPAGSMLIGALPYDSTTQRYWRWRGSGNDVVAEVSPDATTWTQLARQTVSELPPSVRMNLGAGTNNAEAAPGTARFGGFNVCP